MPAPVEPTHPNLPARYIAHFARGKPHPIYDFADEDGSWVLYGTTGGHIKYPSSLVRYFEPTPEAIGVMRNWTDSAGSHHATATFVAIDGGKVVLTKSDGKTVHVPLEKLCEADRDLARRFQDLTNSQLAKGKP